MLRIIFNYSTMRRMMPSIHELEIKTGRTREGVYKVLSVLNNERYIEWSELQPENIILIEGWERQPIYKI